MSLFFAQNVDSEIEGYGYLYNWYAASDVNFAPTDWRIPTSAETISLDSYITNGGDLKEVGFLHWDEPNLGANDSTGFSAFGNGLRSYTDGSFASLRSLSQHWGDGFRFILNNNTTTFIPVSGPFQSTYGLGVRLIYTGTGTPPSTITDYDGNVYDVVQIGTQYWTKQNWKCTHLNNGVEINNITDSCQWANISDTYQFGLIYNFDAVTDVNFGITDWGTPSDDDLNDLISNSGGGTLAGGNLKIDSCVLWNPNNQLGTANNFDSVGSGYKSDGAEFLQRGEVGYIWGLLDIGLGDYLPRALYTYRYNTQASVLNPSSNYNFASRLIYKGTGTPSGTITDYDGNVYNIVQIGNQYWLRENFKCKHLKNGTPIDKVTTNMYTYGAPAYDEYYDLKGLCAYNNDESLV